jgi:Flp pilus assembly pilin Flp
MIQLLMRAFALLRSDEEGQTLEYALILALVSTAGLTIVSAIGSSHPPSSASTAASVGTRPVLTNFQRKPGAQSLSVPVSLKPVAKRAGLPRPASDAGSWECPKGGTKWRGRS